MKKKECEKQTQTELFLSKNFILILRFALPTIFIKPIYLQNKQEISDICFGIGR